MPCIENVGDKEAKAKESNDIWLEGLESKTHMKEDIPKELVADKLEKSYIACDCMERNFQNCLAKETIMELKDNVSPNEDKLDEETTIVVLDCGGL